jgi:FMN reductase
MHLVAISGSPSARSRSAWLLQLAQTRLESLLQQSQTINLRELPAQALLGAAVQQPAIDAALQALQRADVVLIATPIYKAAYSGLLKTFLDLLPGDALRDKTVLPLATGGSVAHMLALDYALKPVLGALGARDILDAVFAADAQLQPHEAGGFVPDAALLQRLDRALRPLLQRRSLPAQALRCSA